MAFLPLSTANLPDPAIDPAKGENPTEYFDVGIWTGDGVNGRTIADLYGHTPDWVWIKNRSAAIDHNVADVLRGFKELYTNLTNAEGSQQMNAPTNDGLSGLPNANGYNNNGNAYVSWAWKAGGSGVSNTDGSITSTVSASTKAGFSIVSYTGNGSSTGNGVVGHGLDSSPEMIIIKARAGTNADNSWYCWHTGLSANNNLNLNDTRAQFTTSSATSGIINTSPTSTTFGFDSGSTLLNINESGTTYIAYCFHSVDGFSKFGSYVGNGTTDDGPFIFTGFRPAFVILKASTVTKNWISLDTARDIDNTSVHTLFPHSSSAEFSQDDRMDILSNGFKIRGAGSSDQNLSGETFIYMAFAEQPFKFSNAR